MLSQVTLMGRLGQDPELRYTKSNPAQAVCTFSLAVQPYGQEEPEWWRVTCWGQQAEFAANNLAQGGRVLVIGTPSLDRWEGRDGAARADLSCNCRTLQAIDRAAAGEEEAERPAEAASPPAAAAAAPREVPGNPRYRGRGGRG